MQQTEQTIPYSEGFPVSVLMEYPRKIGDEQDQGEVIGLVAGAAPEQPDQPVLVRSGERSEQYLWRGFRLPLYRDDAESYYMNLMGEQPRVFVLCRGRSGRLRPFRVTLSYDEAASYMEVDEPVFSLPMPPEVYRWLEGYVLEHYVPERKKKRKRDDWKQVRR